MEKSRNQIDGEYAEWLLSLSNERFVEELANLYQHGIVSWVDVICLSLYKQRDRSDTNDTDE